MRRNALGWMVIAALAGCSSSTSPSTNAIGTWNITVSRMIFVDAGITDTIDVRPAPFPFVVQDTGAGSRGIFPLVYGLDAAGDTILRWGTGTALAVTATGDSLHIVFDDGTEACLLGISGTIHGNAANGHSTLSCADSMISGGSWSATKS